MGKKFLTLFILFFLILGLSGVFFVVKHRFGTRQKNSLQKAPQTSLTLLEGWTIQDIADYLEKNGITTKQDFVTSLNTFDVSKYPEILSKPKNSGLEGFIFPDTYFILKNPATGTNISNVIIEKALDNFTKKITPEMLIQAKSNGLDLYQTITLASIIEKESGAKDSDRKIISGIFYNRLKIGLPLQSDATVNYITKKGLPSPDITDTLIDSPYNTYKYKGLPPGPICNPSLGSIMAALYPTQSDYVYFLTDPKTKNAIFAKTYDEHLANKQKYLK